MPRNAKLSPLQFFIIVILLIILIVSFIYFTNKKTENTSVECKSDFDCKNAEQSFCNRGKCVSCTFNSDCPGTDFCYSGKCVSIQTEPDSAPTCFDNCPLTDVNVTFNPATITGDPPVRIFSLGNKILVQTSSNRSVLICYNVDGTIDTTFGDNGYIDFIDILNIVETQIETGWISNQYMSLSYVSIGSDYFYCSLLARGILQSTGQFSSVSLVAKYDFDGNRDASYGDPTYGFNYSSTEARSLGLIPLTLSDGRVLGTLGYSNLQKYRLTSADGLTMTDVTLTFPDYTINSVDYIDSNTDKDAIYMLGGCTDIGLNYLIYIMKFDTNLSVDISYGNNGIVTIDMEAFQTTLGYNSWDIFQVHPCNDGTVYFSGQLYESTNDRWEIFVTKFLPDGSLDVNFATNGTWVSDQGNDQYTLAYRDDFFLIQDCDNQFLLKFYTESNISPYPKTHFIAKISASGELLEMKEIIAPTEDEYSADIIKLDNGQVATIFESNNIDISLFACSFTGP